MNQISPSLVFREKEKLPFPFFNQEFLSTAGVSRSARWKSTGDRMLSSTASTPSRESSSQPPSSSLISSTGTATCTSSTTSRAISRVSTRAATSTSCSDWLIVNESLFRWWFYSFSWSGLVRCKAKEKRQDSFHWERRQIGWTVNNIVNGLRRRSCGTWNLYRRKPPNPGHSYHCNAWCPPDMK